MTLIKKPFIGLTPSHDTTTDDLTMRPTYQRAIIMSGGIPIILPLEASEADLQTLANTLDGFLFTGGPDVHPFYFGEQTQAHCGNISKLRDTMELSLLRLAMKAKKPILGICRGIQVINIGLGGNIYQDLPSQWKEEFPVAHKQPFQYTIPSHTIDVVADTLLADITGCKSLQVNSMHHQAVKDPAPGLRICGYAPNHLIEALDMPDYPFLLGVQWHPEYLFPTDHAAAQIFQAFIAAC